MNPSVPEGPPVRDASEFFDMCEGSARRVFHPQKTVDYPVLMFFDPEGRVRFRPVADEDEAAGLTRAAWDYPVIAAVGFLRELDGAIVATYRTRAGDEEELRIPILGSGNARTLGASTRRVLASSARVLQ